MAGETRVLNFSEGVSVGTPVTTNVTALGFTSFADDAAYVTAKGEAAAEGDAYYNTTLDVLRYYKNGAWQTQQDQLDPIITADTTQSTDKDTGALIIEGGAGIEKNVNIGGDLTVAGDMTISGTTTTVNTSTLDVEDPSIKVNNGGTEATADAAVAGIEVEMSDAANVKIGFDSTLASKFKANGVELANVSSAQTFTNKSLAGFAINRALRTTGAGVIEEVPSAADGLALILASGVPSWQAITTTPVAPAVKSSAYTALTTDQVILVNTASAFTLTLYPVAGNAGRVLEIIKTTTDLNNLTVDGNAAETINNNLTTSLSTFGESLKILCTGTAWVILNRSCDTSWMSFSPGGSWVTNTTYTGYKRRVGDTAEYDIRLSLTGAPTATTLSVNIPDGTIDVAKMIADGNRVNMGIVSYLDSGLLLATDGRVKYNNTTSVYIGQDSNNYTNTVPITWASGDLIFMKFSVPIVGWHGGDN